MDASNYMRRVGGALFSTFVLAIGMAGGCGECGHPQLDDVDDGPRPPAPPHLDACLEPSDWLGKSCEMLCSGGSGSLYATECSEDCASTVVAYRVWDACYYDEPPEQIFPLDLGCSDILDDSVVGDYHYVSCCCVEYGPPLSETESGG